MKEFLVFNLLFLTGLQAQRSVFVSTCEDCLKFKNHKFCIPHENWQGLYGKTRFHNAGSGWCCNMAN